jgi:hypothetical protein
VVAARRLHRPWCRCRRDHVAGLVDRLGCRRRRDGSRPHPRADGLGGQRRRCRGGSGVDRAATSAVAPGAARSRPCSMPGGGRVQSLTSGRPRSLLRVGSSEVEKVGEDVPHLVQHLWAHVADRLSEPLDTDRPCPGDGALTALPRRPRRWSHHAVAPRSGSRRGCGPRPGASWSQPCPRSTEASMSFQCIGAVVGAAGRWLDRTA